MKISIFKKAEGFILLASLLFTPLLLNAKYVIENQSILEEKTIKKIEEMASELHQKTKVNVYLSALSSLNGKKMIEYELETAKSLSKPYILLAFSLNDKKVDIISSESLKDKFNKEEVLSPYPWEGSIIPLLAFKAKQGQYEAGLLNGFADIVDRVASSYNVKLESSIGSANRFTIGIIRFIFYFIIVVSLLYLLYMKIFKKGLFGKKE